jgi:hypothetical protein
MLKAKGFSLLSSTVFVKQIKASSSQGFFKKFANLFCKRDGKKRFFLGPLYFLPSPKRPRELLLSKISIAYAIGGFHKDR